MSFPVGQGEGDTKQVILGVYFQLLHLIFSSFSINESSVYISLTSLIFIFFPHFVFICKTFVHVHLSGIHDEYSKKNSKLLLLLLIHKHSEQVHFLCFVWYGFWIFQLFLSPEHSTMGSLINQVSIARLAVEEICHVIENKVWTAATSLHCCC